MITDYETKFIYELTEVISQYINENSNKATPVVKYHNARRLRQNIDLSIGNIGAGLDELMKSIKEYLNFSVRTSHRYFGNQLFSGFNFPAFIGDLVTTLTNTTMATFEAAPMGTLMEEELIKKINSRIAYIKHGNEAEGIMVPGGSNANMIAMLCARNRALPYVKKEGLTQNNLIMFVSDQAHYSFKKMANVLGLGSDNIVEILTDKNACMIPEELERSITENKEAGRIPFFVAATSGTTVFGSFDPLDKIGQIAQKHDLWFHIDGAWGGIVMFSKKYKHLLKGVELSDSFTWDAHKLLGIPLTASFFLCKTKGTMLRTNSCGSTEYLFHTSENEEFDTGPKSLQCGRRVDSLKLWLSWKFLGDEGIASIINKLMDRVSFITEIIKDNTNIDLIKPPVYLNVCFRVNMKNNRLRINSLNRRIRDRLLQTGEFFINYSTTADGTFFFRLIVNNPDTTNEDYINLFKRLTEISEDIIFGKFSKETSSQQLKAD